MSAVKANVSLAKMESKRPDLEDDLSCPVCQEIFKNPVMLTCSHSVCSDCLKIFWEAKEASECPVCRKRAANETPLLNLALKNVCEAFRQERNKGVSLCSQHQQKLELLCIEDKVPVCLVCRDSKEHRYHNFKSVSEVAAGLRVKYLCSLCSLMFPNTVAWMWHKIKPPSANCNGRRRLWHHYEYHKKTHHLAASV